MSKDIEHLANEFNRIKAEMDVLKEAKWDIEKQLIDIIGCKDEGSTSLQTDNVKVTTTGKFSRKLMNGVTFEHVANVIGYDDAVALLKPDYRIQASVLRRLPEEKAKAVRHLIVAKPQKPQVSTKLLD